MIIWINDSMRNMAHNENLVIEHYAIDKPWSSFDNGMHINLSNAQFMV